MEERKLNSRRVPLDKRKRTENSCDKCKSRKQKCHRPPGNNEATCSYCLKHNIPCITTQPRKTRIYGSVEGLSTRLALLEGLVKGLLPEADLTSVEDMRELGNELGIPLPAANDATTALLTTSRKRDAAEADERLLRDQQGQTQYIGPASSFLFHFKLRTIFGRVAPQVYNQMFMFGRNASERQSPDANAILGNGSTIQGIPNPEWDILSVSASSPGADASPISPADGSVLETLVVAFFDHVHPDFPVLHEASFRETYEAWTNQPSNADRAWLCCLLCVLLLGRRVAPIHVPDLQEDIWWRQVQALLPTVIFSSSVTAVQALLLASLHLHNNSHRDACWTLTGAAVRIAFAIGLHRDGLKTTQTPLSRELRKQLWWTLYSFEKMQVSSHDRPSAIEDAVYSVGCPRESILGMGGHSPPDYLAWSNRLTVMLGMACRATRAGTVTFDDATIGPLSPTARLLRDLDRWKQSLPQHLRPDVIETLPPSFQRPIILLHCQYHYIVSLISRSALLSRATTCSAISSASSSSINPNPNPSTTTTTSAPSPSATTTTPSSSTNPNSHGSPRSKPLPLTTLQTSESCIASGRALAHLLLKLDSINKYNAVTWWDIYYTFSSALILVLDIICNKAAAQNESAAESRRLLGSVAALLARQTENPMCPGTMQKWAEVAQEMDPMTEEFLRGFEAGAGEAERQGVMEGVGERAREAERWGQEGIDVKAVPQDQSHAGVGMGAGVVGSAEGMAGPSMGVGGLDDGVVRQHEDLHEEDANGEPDTTMGSMDLVGNHDMGMLDTGYPRMNGHMRWTQLNFPDHTSANADMWQEIHWDDIGNMLLGGDQ